MDEVFYDAEDKQKDYFDKISDISEIKIQDVDDDDDSDSNESFKENNQIENGLIPRRKVLPSKICGGEISILGILRRNMGKDMSQISMPISTNEPLSLLQRISEDFEYLSLIFKAIEAGDSIQRLAYMAAFVVSSYSSSFNRTTRKPFNPLLGETFVLDRPDLNLRYFAEKVSHRPVIVAFNVSHPKFKIWGSIQPKTTFWGKSLELINLGTIHCKFFDTLDYFTWTKVKSKVKNLLAGTKYLEHVGNCTILNHKTNEYCELEFIESGYFKGSSCEVKGTIYDSEKKIVCNLKGKWNDSFYKQIDSDKLELLWQTNPFPPENAEYYGFSQFTMQLNEITPDIQNKLPATDSRLRPDQRKMEEGNIVEAEEEKQRLEEKQRSKRKEMEELGIVWKPRWFNVNFDEVTNQHDFVFNEKFWEMFDKGELTDIETDFFA
ncbi:Oxysterol-binding protein [Rozella allomycis CSF55]|uniref:Oxysterol-binding protein n=1 Tax=Rozella allomycis (strain CSF55) TaxID=988480 RepID=A0A4P9YI41_ROZAC|nr:Oxysterol-binding protein [Rozella allomycis CSF55]